MAVAASLTWNTFGVALCAALGTFLFGFDTGIITTTIAHESWTAYMDDPSTAIIGAIVSSYIGGEAVGSVVTIFLGDKLGRRRYMLVLSVLVTISVIIQTAAVNMPMFLAGRALAGVAVGGMYSTVPVYLSEIAAPDVRGLVGGLAGLGISCGIMISNWVGFACGYAPYGQLQWRLPLGLQAPWGIILFVGLLTFIPDSPRHLIRIGDVPAARKAFERIRSDLGSDEAEREFLLMQSQIEYEKERELKSYKEVFRLYRYRALCSIAVNVLTSITGVNVIQYFQTRLYRDLGMTGNTVLALAAAWGTTGFLSNAFSLRYLADRFGRRPMLLTGLTLVATIDIYSAVMQREFQHTDNRVGKGFGILGIYLFVVAYYATINSTTPVYMVEVLPIAIRSRVVGLACAIKFAINAGLNQAAPSAFADIGENYYYVFVGLCIIWAVGIYFLFPETRGKTLEAVAAAFGDRVVDIDSVAVEQGSSAIRKSSMAAHVEGDLAGDRKV